MPKSRNKVIGCHRHFHEDIHLFFKYFLAVGIPFPIIGNSRLKYVLEKILYWIFNILSVYLFILDGYHLFFNGFNKQILVMGAFHTFALALRLHFVYKGKDILLSFYYLQKLRSMKVTVPQQSYRKWIVISSTFSYISAVTMALVSFWRTPNQVKINSDYQIFGYNSSGNYQNVFVTASAFIWTGKHLILFVIPSLTVFLLCHIFHTLGSLMSDYKKEITGRYFNSVLKSNNIRKLAVTLRQLSTAVTEMDKKISPATMYLLCIFVSHILMLTSALSKNSSDMFNKILASFLVVTLLIALFAVIVLGARIEEIFSEIEKVILDATLPGESIFADISIGINRIELYQTTNILVGKTHMTAMGVFKIERSVILTLLCAFVSYSVLLTQVLNE